MLLSWLRKNEPSPADCPVLQGILIPMHVSHRGGASSFGPENTLYNYRRCIELGTDVLEFDVRHAADDDGVELKYLVISHDETVDRTTDGKGPVDQLTLDQIRSLDAAFNFSRDGGDSFPLRGQGYQVPVFTEVLDLLEEFPKQRFYVDLKSVEVVDRVVAEIKRRDMFDRCFLGAVPAKVNKRMLALRPAHVPCTPDINSMFVLFFFYTFGLMWLIPFRHHIVGVTIHRMGIKVLSKKLVDAFHSRGRLVAVFGPDLDTVENQEFCLECGVDMFVTDRPDLLKQTFSKITRVPFGTAEGEKKTK